MTKIEDAQDMIELWSDKLDIPEYVVREAQNIFEKAVQQKVKTTTYSAVAVASVFAACRIHKVLRTIQDFQKATSLSGVDISRRYRSIATKLNLSIPNVEPSMFVNRIMYETTRHSRNYFGPKTGRVALDLLSKSSSNEAFASLSPKVIAASALYGACVIEGDKISQAAIATGAGISDVTIRKYYPIFVELWKNENGVRTI